jgi:glycosyltransferase involved in cell wall biosynthesis
MVFHFPPISGGGVVVIVELANTLAKLGHDVTILTPNLEWTGPEYNPIINSRINVIKVKTPSSSNLKIASRRCFSNMRKKGIELGEEEKFEFILTIFHPFHLVPKAAVSCGKELGIPVIVKIDDAVYQKARGIKSIQRKIEKIYNTKTLQNATRVLVSNQNTKDLVNSFYTIPINNISITPNGVDLSRYHSDNTRSKEIIFSGAMYDHRGIDMLLNAVPNIIKQIPDAKVILLGSGPELEKLQEISIQKNISENVDFKGWIDREEIHKYLAKAEIGIGPLRLTDVTKNALPIKVLEYMASSLPVIAMTNTLPNDVLENEKNGYFIENEDELASKIIFLLENNKTRIKMGQESKDMVAKFDWSHIASAIIQEYEDVASSS